MFPALAKPMPEPTHVHQIPPPPLHLGPQLASARAAKVAPVVAQLDSPPTLDVLQKAKRAKVPHVMLSAERDAASCARRDFGAELVHAA
jgi:hypothetical protein